ncbi:MAG: YfhO family protein [Planctomycetaceae bacterium]
MSPEFFFEHPLTAADMLQWFNPFLTDTRVFGQNTHELGLYCGALPFLLAIVAITRLRSQSSHRRLLQVMLALGLLALWLSFGKAGGLYVVQTWLPMIGKFRWPSRILVLLHFVVAVFATAGYVRISSVSGTALAAGVSLETNGNVSSSRGPSQLLPRIVYLVPIASILCSLLASVICGRDHVAPWTLLLLGPILFILAAILVRDVSRGRYSPAFMLFLAGDLAAYGFTYEALSRKQAMPEIVAELQTPPGSPNDGRVIAEVQLQNGDEQFHGNKLLLKGWQQADGYEGLMSSRSLLGDNLTLDGLRIAGVRWVINEGRHNSIAGLRPTVDPGWLEVPDPLTRVRLTRNVRQVSNAAEALQHLSAEGPAVVECDPRQRSAIKEFDLSANAPAHSAIAKSGTVNIVSDRPGLIEVDVECSSSQLLILSESYSPGWKVTVNGERSSLFRAEVDYMACAIPAGQSRVQLRFEPDSVTAGIRITVASLWLIGFGTAVSCFLRFREFSQRKSKVGRTTADGVARIE